MDDKKCRQSDVDIYVIVTAPDRCTEETHSKAIVHAMQRKDCHEADDHKRVEPIADFQSSPTQHDVSDEKLAAHREATTLDRLHAAMLLHASGRANALRALLKAEQERGPDFLRLANALSALYPKDSEEKRLLDAMLLAVPR